MTKHEETNGEIGMPGAFFGGILGGLVFGCAADILDVPGNAMAYYALGVVLGAAFGTVAAHVIAKKLRSL